ncbi:tyrosine-type recombinase/integrase [Cellulophaga baltica]|uniref:tyrosine-type recombinase/integrase n=1 Tax=Cellulophaga TaxID=104264 RepID=UPI001C06CFC7|nr:MULTISPECIES: tyrosine-type recombinase/integrase [Cellulophaga]MBU2994940.1 tyrosine-type recombinase/integrase [Cellulophaga baltica]MDO6766334.1 tyrosine-type recombinase/integrase [Cellulophaga sp. 1_MG-2023]
MSISAFITYISLEKNYSANTVTAYESDIVEFSIFCKEHLGVQDITDVGYNSVRSWVVSLVDVKLSNRSINRKIASLKSYYKFLLKIEAIKVNPLAKHKALKTAKKIEIPFSEAEMEQMLSEIIFPDDFVGLRDKLIIELLYVTGIRRIELVNLRITDIDFNQKTIKVLGKRNKQRVIPLLGSMLDLFKVYLQERNKIEKLVDKEFIFLSKTGFKIYDTLVYRVINHYFSMVSSKVKKSPHILRHTFATHLINKGADLNSVKELLGHSSLASTQVYTHNSVAELKKVHQLSHPRNKK